MDGLLEMEKLLSVLKREKQEQHDFVSLTIIQLRMIRHNFVAVEGKYCKK